MGVPDLLRGCPLFYELYDKEIEKVVNRCEVFELTEGEFVIKDGEEGDQIFVVLDGTLMVQKDTPGGLIEIQPLKSGDVFGEMVLVGEKIRSADVVAKEKSHLIEISYENIFKLYKSEPKIFGLMILNLSRLLSNRLKASNQIIVNLQNQLGLTA